MKIGIDISQSIYKGTGVGRFTTGLAHAICKYGSSHEWHFFFSSLRQKPDVYLEKEIRDAGFTIHTAKFPATVLATMWNDAHIIPVESFIKNLDWFITSDWTEPPAKCKKATMIHDLAFMRHPETVDAKIQHVQKSRIKRVTKESTVIFSDSQATKDDVVNLLSVEETRVHVNYPALDFVLPANETISNTIKKYNINKPFILTVGKLEPRKNLPRLIEAFQSIDHQDTELFIVGEKGWGAHPKSNDKNIRFLGYVSDDELAALYTLCVFFIYPSIWEGFGYPIIEAMNAGSAVATSNSSSLKEIGGKNALLFDPHEVPDIAQAMTKLLTDVDYRNKLAAKGKEYSKEYTWKRYYDTLVTTLQNAS